MLAPGRVATGRDGRDRGSSAHLSGGPRARAETDLLMFAFASRGVCSSVLGWQPTQPGLLDDLGKGHYFDRLSSNG